ncbi:pantoate--beta-alanine ligase [Mangrovicoccus algicola]|uniref:Pantothenate synthetase n=1 Tax=Mangrovicoccus algicola TaxID=2771008 RepID=A0A8J6Z4J8_9RHOB|nr:pantoate--beta-alanine ligase [Mangrovicoccus algicola]MBE3636626.1 pantoate--beta-alanine ligase [Mangrovicoccus algicola]
MDICRSKTGIRRAIATMRAAGAERIGFVPTMGALHEGHLSLVRMAKARGDRVVVSVFVNPTQFEDPADLAKYPRDDARDLDLLRAEGVDAVFLPGVEEMYPEGAQTIVETTTLSKVLIGALRPGHFRGVATVVTKLFNIVGPDFAVFGEKDYQQLAVIRTMVRDLDMPVEILGHPILRETDGLAMSSRNVRLDPAHRAEATVLSRALDRAEALAARPVTAEELQAEIALTLAEAPAAEVETIDIQDAATLADLSGALERPAVILLAVRFGPVLLIDNRVVTPA